MKQLAMLGLALCATFARAQTPESCAGGVVAPDFGYGFLYCPGGKCLAVHYEHGVARTVYLGAPSLHKIKADGPGAGLLMEDDVLEGVDDLPITTLAGLEHFDVYRPGVVVVLNVRRAGVRVDVPIKPLPVCRRGSTKEIAKQASTATAITGSAWFGFGLSCNGCVARSSANGVPHWAFPVNPVIQAIDAEGPAALAGLKVGDTLLAIDHHSLQSDAGGLRLRSARAGERVELTFLRAGIERSATVRPVERGPAQP